MSHLSPNGSYSLLFYLFFLWKYNSLSILEENELLVSNGSYSLLFYLFYLWRCNSQSIFGGNEPLAFNDSYSLNIIYFILSISSIEIILYIYDIDINMYNMISVIFIVVEIIYKNRCIIIYMNACMFVYTIIWFFLFYVIIISITCK